MGTLYFSAPLDVPADVAWDFLDRYTRSEVHVFSNCTDERQEGEFRVVTLQDGSEIWERNVTVDHEHRRAVYAIDGLLGSEHHQAEMRVDVDGSGAATLVWITDFLPQGFAEMAAEAYAGLWVELQAAVNGHR